MTPAERLSSLGYSPIADLPFGEARDALEGIVRRRPLPEGAAYWGKILAQRLSYAFPDGSEAVNEIAFALIFLIGPDGGLMDCLMTPAGGIEIKAQPDFEAIKEIHATYRHDLGEIAGDDAREGEGRLA